MDTAKSSVECEWVDVCIWRPVGRCMMCCDDRAKCAILWTVNVACLCSSCDEMLDIGRGSKSPECEVPSDSLHPDYTYCHSLVSP